MAIYVEVRVIGRADNLLIQRHEFKSKEGAERYVAELDAANKAGGDHSGYYGTIVEGDLPHVDLCEEVVE